MKEITGKMILNNKEVDVRITLSDGKINICIPAGTSVVNWNQSIKFVLNDID